MGKWIINGRLRIPISSRIIGILIHPLQPRFLKRWYYRKSFDWWRHPSNHHWKYFEFGYFQTESKTFKFLLKLNQRREFERDLWTGNYKTPKISDSDYTKKIRLEKIDLIFKNSSF